MTPVTSAAFPPRQSAQLSNPGLTPAQTVGPFFGYGLTPRQYGYDFAELFSARMAQPHASGEHIEVFGQVWDGDGLAITDALIELTQTDASGAWVLTPEAAKAGGFSGFGRCGTGATSEGGFCFQTVRPGVCAADKTAGFAPRLHLNINMRGLLVTLATRVYFDDADNAHDPVLAQVPAARQGTLLARLQTTTPHSVRRYRFDLRMQGPAETVFFAY